MSCCPVDREKTCTWTHLFTPELETGTHTCTHQRSPMKPHVSKRVSRRQLGSEPASPFSGGMAPQVIGHSVHHLAEALSHIEQGIERRYLKPPLGKTVWTLKVWKSAAGQTGVSAGEEDSKKEQKMKKNKKRDEDRDSEGRAARLALAAARRGP